MSQLSSSIQELLLWAGKPKTAQNPRFTLFWSGMTLNFRTWLEKATLARFLKRGLRRTGCEWMRLSKGWRVSPSGEGEGPVAASLPRNGASPLGPWPHLSGPVAFWSGPVFLNVGYGGSPCYVKTQGTEARWWFVCFLNSFVIRHTTVIFDIDSWRLLRRNPGSDSVTEHIPWI